MALTIRTTGVEDYIDGSANLKCLIIGGPGVGKTRSSSFWPKPIFADCEGGRGSIADRNVPYAEIGSSQDMLDFLQFCKDAERVPKAQRKFQTVVIDTIDAFQRRVKDEWMLQNKKGVFTGYDAWGYLDSKVQMLLARLLNLDSNVLVLSHFKDKTIKSEDGTETRELQLQLQGEVKDQIFNDFDLVGWLGTYWDKENGERVEKRGLTFNRTPDKPFLKDRFGVMPKWIPVTFSVEDHALLLASFLSRVDSLTESVIVGEIPTSGPGSGIAGPNVVAPTGGALPPVDAKPTPLEQYDKPTLLKMCRDVGITTTADGQPIRANTIKGELVEAIRKFKKDRDAVATTPPAQTDATPASAPKQIPGQTTVEEHIAEIAPEAPVETVPVPDEGVAAVNPANGEITYEATHEEAVETALAGLGGQVVSETPPAEAPQVPRPTAATRQPTAGVCEEDGCTKQLAGEKQVYVNVSVVKFGKKYCNEHFFAHKAAASAA